MGEDQAMSTISRARKKYHDFVGQEGGEIIASASDNRNLVLQRVQQDDQGRPVMEIIFEAHESGHTAKITQI